MSHSQLAVHAAWYMGVPVGLLQPMIGRKLRKAGVDREKKNRPKKGHYQFWLSNEDIDA
jgi:hypothetical protein